MPGYSPEDANLITQMLKDLANLRQKHPFLKREIDSIEKDLVELREFIISMLKSES